MKKISQKTIKKLIYCALSLGALCMITVICINAHMLISTSDDVDTAHTDKKADCILVLGCLVKADGTPSDMLKDRLDTAIALFNEGVSDRIVMSGDHGRVEYDEVYAMKKYAIDRGVPSEAIFMDHAGFSTYESMYRLKNVFLAESAVVVTQGYHLPRALYIAKSLGIDTVGESADLHTYRGQIKRDIREAAARSKDFFISLTKPESTYVGSPVPLNGNGDITNDKKFI